MGIHLVEKKLARQAGYRGEGSRNKPWNFWGALQCFEGCKDNAIVAGNYSLYNAEAPQNKAQMPTTISIYSSSIKCIKADLSVSLSRILEQA